MRLYHFWLQSSGIMWWSREHTFCFLFRVGNDSLDFQSLESCLGTGLTWSILETADSQVSFSQSFRNQNLTKHGLLSNIVLLLCRFIFCRSVLTSFSRTEDDDPYLPQCHPNLPELLSSVSKPVQSSVQRLAEHLGVAKSFHFTNT